MPLRQRPPGDQKLVQIVNAALADSAARSGTWLACGPGCSKCCVGVFAINQLDVLRLQEGLTKMYAAEPERAARIQQRARDAVARFGSEFPGDPTTGILGEGDVAEERFQEFANDEPCPALNPETGHCEVYESRPVMCRTFGPPIREEDGLGVCELCFDGATEEQIEACEMVPDPDNLEATLLKQLEETGARGETIVAFALALAEIDHARNEKGDS